MTTYLHRAPSLLVSLALLAASLSAPAQITAANDPANLAGERVSVQDPADTLPINHGAPALEQLLRKLRTRASFMLIVAHPDDEDGGLLTYLSRGQGARVAMLTLNRGEGGQNLMSADFDDALGLLRTQELLAADRTMGVDQMFGTEVDFGFSKTKEEAFAKWTHDRVLYDAVRAIRLYRPLVIASVFIGAPSDGHGQHQVAGEIAQEAFKAAADPTVFPDQIAAGLQPWQPLKVYARIPFARIDAQGMYDYATSQYVPARFPNYVTGKVTNTVPKASVVIPEGTPDPLLGGLSYVQFARQGLALQKSQIGPNAGRLAPGGRADVSYHRYGSCVTPNSGCPIHRDSAMSGSSDASPTALRQTDPPAEFDGTESSLFDGIDTTIKGIASLAPDAPRDLAFRLNLLQQQIETASRLPADQSSSYAPLLADTMRSLDDLISNLETMTIPDREKFDVLHELHVKRVQLNDALVLALGVSVTTQLKTDHRSECVRAILPGCIAEIDTNFTNGPVAPVRVQSDFTSYNGTSEHERTFAPSTAVLQPGERIMPDRAVVEESWPRGNVAVLDSKRIDPFALKQAEGRPYFSRPDIEQPFYDLEEPALRSAPMTLEQAFWTRFDYAGVSLLAGCRITAAAESGAPIPLWLEPSFSISFDSSVKVIPNNMDSFSVMAHVRGLAGKSPNPPPGIEIKVPTGWHASLPANETHFGQTDNADISFIVTRPKTSTVDTISASVESISDTPISESFRAVGYPGLTPTNYYTPATLRIVPVDVHTAPNLNIAYLPGTGDDVPAYLPSLGITPTILTLADLTPTTLAKYDAVLLGVRAYTAHPELAGAGSQPLIDYARSGGVVILQYNNGRYGAAEAPYPITTPGSSGDHATDVIDETAPVTLLAPNSPLLTWPNRITPSDFDHWVTERGHAFAGTWSSDYTPLLETHDPGQPPQQGGLLFARVGKGAYIYCGLALYRQLPEGVPGAYRLLANLISAAKNPALISASK